MMLLLPGASSALGTGWAGIWGGQGLPRPTPFCLATSLMEKQACLQRISFFHCSGNARVHVRSLRDCTPTHLRSISVLTFVGEQPRKPSKAVTPFPISHPPARMESPVVTLEG